MSECRGCGKTALEQSSGSRGSAGCPLATDPVRADEASHSLAMDLCDACGLAQLADDDTVSDEPRGIEPQALKDQATTAVEQVAAAGWLRGDTVLEFGSPHGGTWVPMLTERGFTTSTSQADVVLDCFGIMHEPDQRSAFARRAEATAPGGVLLLQYHPIGTIVGLGQWNALRHGHFPYYSLTTLVRLLGVVGMRIVHRMGVRPVRGNGIACGRTRGGRRTRRLCATYPRVGGFGGGDRSGYCRRTPTHSDQHAASLRNWLEGEAAAGYTVLAYGAASRAVALFSRAGVDSRLVVAVADASPAKQGRRMPGTDIPIVTPDQLLAAKPDRVLLTLPDLLPEVSARFPELDGRWTVDGQWPVRPVAATKRPAGIR